MAEIIQRELFENGEVVGYEYGGRLVRCKDCKYYYVYDKHNFCDLDIEMMRDLDPNYYCASAERKKNETN